VLGILSIFTCITGIPAAILGFMALGDINRSPRTVGGKGLAITGIVTGIGGMFVSVILILLALLLPAIQATRAAAQRTQSINQMRMMTLAAHMFESTNRKLPDDIKSPDGRPLLSWRVHILPYIEQKALYDQFKLDEPWDSPHNLPLSKIMPPTFVSPNSLEVEAGKTVYLRPKGKEMVLGGTTPDGEPIPGFNLGGIVDGTSNTLFLVEADADQAVPWTKPDDLNVDLKQPRRGLGKQMHGRFIAAFLDGTVRVLDETIPDQTIGNIMTPDGNAWGRRENILGLW